MYIHTRKGQQQQYNYYFMTSYTTPPWSQVKTGFYLSPHQPGNNCTDKQHIFGEKLSIRSFQLALLHNTGRLYCGEFQLQRLKIENCGPRGGVMYCVTSGSTKCCCCMTWYSCCTKVATGTDDDLQRSNVIHLACCCC